MSFNFRLFRLRRRPVIRRPLSLLAIVVRPLRVVASSAACLPRVIGYRPLTQQPPTSSLRPPPPPALFSCSLRRPLPALATANRRCRPTAPILTLLRPPPALLLVVSRPLPAPIVVVGAREGRGGDAAGALLVPKIGSTKARSTTMACRLRPRPRGGGRWRRPSSSPLAPTSFSSSSTRRRHRPPPPPRRGGSNDRCVGSSCWRRTIYPPPCPRRRSLGRMGSICRH